AQALGVYDTGSIALSSSTKPVATELVSIHPNQLNLPSLSMETWAIAVIVVGSVFGLPLLFVLVMGVIACCIGCVECKKAFCGGGKPQNRRRGAVAPTGQFAMQPPSYSESNPQRQRGPYPQAPTADFMMSNTAYPPPPPYEPPTSGQGATATEQPRY
ncbi:hypothetical protein BOX15_Mlig015372g4, partial [Macrostomum lignano]